MFLMESQPETVAVCCAGSQLERRVRAAVTLATTTYVAHANGVDEWSKRPIGSYLPPPRAGQARFTWELMVASRMLDLSRDGWTVYALGFDSRTWVSSLAALGRSVVLVKPGPRELEGLRFHERRAHRAAQAGIFK